MFGAAGRYPPRLFVSQVELRSDRLIYMHRFLIALMLVTFWSSSAQDLPAVSPNLQPPAGETLLRQVNAVGDQVYTCDGSKWVLAGPDAKLFDEAGKQVGSHFAGPTWEWSDGSRVVGRPIATATPDPNSIPWLLLTAVDHQGDGFMKQVSSIQRLATKGGKAPGEGCDGSHKDEQTRAHYTATYRFYARGR
jgi:hypothetical protein